MLAFINNTICPTPASNTLPSSEVNPTCFQGNTLLQHSLSPSTLRYIWMGQDCLKLSSVNLNPFICNLGQIFYNETPKERFWFWISSITLGCCYEVLLGSFDYSICQPFLRLSFPFLADQELSWNWVLTCSLVWKQQIRKRKTKKTWQQDC